MPCSPARLEANRNNAKKSCGPKTAEGKERSRANALKHGMTGDGVVLIEADKGEVAKLATQLEAEMRPSGAMGRILLRRVAVLAVRLDRCVEHDAAMTAARVRDAARDFDLARLAEVEALGARIEEDPPGSVDGLKRTAEGIAWLIRAWQAVRGVLGRPEQERWGPGNLDRIDHLLGRDHNGYPPTAFDGPSRAAWGDFSGWSEGKGTMSSRRRMARARDQVAAMIDVEIEALRSTRPTRDEADEARDRAEAPGRALFDPSVEADRARRYEAAAERGMFRALREFHQVEEMARAGADEGASPARRPIAEETTTAPGSRSEAATPVRKTNPNEGQRPSVATPSPGRPPRPEVRKVASTSTGTPPGPGQPVPSTSPIG